MDTHPPLLESAPVVIGTREEALEIARSLKGRLRERIGQSQELRQLPRATVGELLESGLCGLMKPRRYGGSELGVETLIEVAAELSSADPSAGWVYMLWTSHMWLQALWPEKAMNEMWEDPNSLASSVTATTGSVEAVHGGYRWTGRGMFSSGVNHCSWLTALVPVIRDGERAEMRWLLIPRDDLEILDDWHTVGLRGTGSNTVVLTDVFVPEYRTVPAEAVIRGDRPGEEVNTHPMYSASQSVNLFAPVAAPAIGAAQGLIETFHDRIAAKLEASENLNSPFPAGVVPQTMSRLAQASASVDAGLALLLLNAQRFSLRSMADLSSEQDVRLRRDNVFAAQQSRRAANMLFEESGGGALMESNLVQLFWRDTNAASAHRGLMWDWQSDMWTKAVLGLPLGP